MNKFATKASINRVLRATGWLLLGLYVLFPDIQIAFLQIIYPQAGQYVHSRLSLAQMTLTHILIALGATLISGAGGISIGFLVTHGRGKAFSGITSALNSMVQTVPPAAVVILAFPLLGFGWPPTVLALVLYSLFPILSNTIMGFYSIPPGVIDSASGMGMNQLQRLRMVELPLASPLILSGLRHSFILNIGTATIGAVIGGGGLGIIIISGLTLQNPALVLSGTIVISGIAILTEGHKKKDPS